MRWMAACVVTPLFVIPLLAAVPAQAAIASPSPGCTQMNSATYDGVYTSSPSLSVNFGWTFAAGEQLIVTVGAPSSGTSLVTRLQVTGSTTTTLSGGVPGAFTYTLTEDLDATGEGVSWGITSGTGGTINATWAVECVPYSAPAPGAITDNDTPADAVQEIGLLNGRSCLDVDETTLDWGRGISGGWSPSWAQWMNNGAGGAVCTRTIHYDTTRRAWSARI